MQFAPQGTFVYNVQRHFWLPPLLGDALASSRWGPGIQLIILQCTVPHDRIICPQMSIEQKPPS